MQYVTNLSSIISCHGATGGSVSNGCNQIDWFNPRKLEFCSNECIVFRSSVVVVRSVDVDYIWVINCLPASSFSPDSVFLEYCRLNFADH